MRMFGQKKNQKMGKKKMMDMHLMGVTIFLIHISMTFCMLKKCGEKC
jgi:hypothetical protein